MTIPTLMAKIRRAQYSAAFKKGLSTLNQAVKMNYANYGWDFSGLDEYCPNHTTDIGNYQNTRSICALIEGNLKVVSKPFHSSVRDSFVSTYYDIYSHLPWGSEANYIEWQLSDGIVVGLSYDAYRYGCTKDNFVACQGYINVKSDVSEYKPLSCEDVDKLRAINADDYEECTISDKDLGNVVPIFFYDQTVVPATNAARALLNGK
jgi:hypothetical protein